MNTITIDDLIAKLQTLKAEYPDVKYVACDEMHLDSIDDVVLSEDKDLFLISYGKYSDDEIF